MVTPEPGSLLNSSNSKGKEYEDFLVSLLGELRSAAQAERSGHLQLPPDAEICRQRSFTRSSTNRPIKMDVVMESKMFGKFIWVFECKNYRKRLTVGLVDEFIAKLNDLRGYTNCHKGIVVTTKGLQDGARDRCKTAGIGVLQIGKEGHMNLLVESVAPELTARPVLWGCIEFAERNWNVRSAYDLLNLLVREALGEIK